MRVEEGKILLNRSAIAVKPKEPFPIGRTKLTQPVTDWRYRTWAA